MQLARRREQVARLNPVIRVFRPDNRRLACQVLFTHQVTTRRQHGGQLAQQRQVDVANIQDQLVRVLQRQRLFEVVLQPVKLQARLQRGIAGPRQRLGRYIHRIHLEAALGEIKRIAPGATGHIECPPSRNPINPLLQKNAGLPAVSIGAVAIALVPSLTVCRAQSLPSIFAFRSAKGL